MDQTTLTPVNRRDALPSQERGLCNTTNNVRVLIVDDDDAIARLIQSALVRHEFGIDVVSETHLIEEQLRTHHYQLIILDYVLPGVESSQVLEWIQLYQSEASIIVVTAFPSMDSALHCLRAHTFDYLTKPFAVEDMRRSVLRCLESRGLMRLSEHALKQRLGVTIRERRKALGLTLAETAERASVSLGYLSQIELGKNSASIETLYRIALGLQIRLADLFQTLQMSS
jgi:DNA-binding NtrC family response regulator